MPSSGAEVSVRRVASTRFSPLDVRQERCFSTFDHVEDSYAQRPSIQRLFAQAHDQGVVSFVTETIPEVGVVAAENQDIRARYPRFRMTGLERVSFWKENIQSEEDFEEVGADSLIGYAILKRDKLVGRGWPAKGRWHVFESVFNPRGEQHSYVPCAHVTTIRIGCRTERLFEVRGALYGEQNHLNKACAHVALRSVAAMHRPDLELAYDEIDRLAKVAQRRGDYQPDKGLQQREIETALRGLEIEFDSIAYNEPEDLVKDPEAKQSLITYQRLLYAGLESGYGALLGFRLDGKSEHHIIPVFGHTFNRHTWVPHSNSHHFQLEGRNRHMPSDSWLDSFIAHDDSFGSNFCVPRFHVDLGRAAYVAALRAPAVRYNGVFAETLASSYLHSILNHLRSEGGNSRWMQRLIKYSKQRLVVLRSVAMTPVEYCIHLATRSDWVNRREDLKSCEVIADYLREVNKIWVVEVSLPDLFPIAQRKLGEVILDAELPISKEVRRNKLRRFDHFLFARFPERYLFCVAVDSDGKPSYDSYLSDLGSHTAVYTRNVQET